MPRTILILLVLGLVRPAAAQVSRVDLSEYRLTSAIPLPTSIVSEASAVTYNWDNGNLYVMGDEGTAIGQFSRAGGYINQMLLSGFEDTEGLTYAGGGHLVIADERIQDAFLTTYAAGTTAVRSTLQSVSLGPTVGNVGIEGISYEPGTGLYFAVKERMPMRVMQVQANFPAGTAIVTDLFDPALLGVTDLSDIAVLSSVPSLIGTPDQNNLLLLSQESARLLKVSRAGTVLGSFDLSAVSSSAEGVTIDANGVIYIVTETPQLLILQHFCRVDLNGNNAADIGDIFLFLSNWFRALPGCDWNGNSQFDVGDVFAFLASWFRGCG